MQQAGWQRMGREVEITIEDEAAAPKGSVRVCFAWQYLSGERKAVPALVSNVEPLTGNKKGLKIVAVVPELPDMPSRFAEAGKKPGIFAQNNAFALADVYVFYSVVKDGQLADVRKTKEFGVIPGNTFCDYPFPSTTAGSGSLTVSDRKNWQPSGGEIEFTVKVPAERRIPPDALVKTCFRWILAEGDNPGPFLDSGSTRIISTSPDTLKMAAVVPDLANQPPRFAENDPTQTKLNRRGQYAIPYIAVPRADMRVILFDADGFPIADVISSVGITSYWLSLLLVLASVGLLYFGLRYAWRHRLAKFTKAGPLLCIVTSRNGNASLSQFQVMLWTVVVAASTVYVIALSGELIPITSGTLVLLGISGAAGVVSKVKSENDAASEPPAPTPAAAAGEAEIAKGRAEAAVRDLSKTTADSPEEEEAKKALAEANAKAIAAQAAAEAADARAVAAKARIDIITATDKPAAEAAAKAAEDIAAAKVKAAAIATAKATMLTRLRHPRWSDLVMEETQGREIDVARVQMLLFTMITAIFVLLRVGTSFVIPDIPDGFLILMGISNSVYVGSKFATNPAAK